MIRPLVRPHLLTIIALVVAPVLLGCGQASSSTSETAEVLDQGMVGGRVTSTAHPAVGYLADESAELPFCTASLVAPTYVITAAHCVKGVSARSLVFGTGKFDLEKRRTSIVRCKANPKYRDTDGTSVYDFAYCELAEASGIAPLSFVNAPAKSATYLALGYGQTDAEDPESSGPRKQLSVRRVDVDDEPDLLEGLENMLATTSTRGDLCFGDSGSPLLVIGSNGARIAGVLHAGIGYEDAADCSPGNVSLWAPIAKNRTFFEAR